MPDDGSDHPHGHDSVDIVCVFHQRMDAAAKF
ncbi:hypothetical protein V473_13875 [Sphingobium cupriresistens LL01]|uniref:Uncharacterized protein n=1 Tax=Sphingobium cupriresistens LL01 TaxID=1420583 RepID=A0A0J7XXI8_9SPHN|nr:hypothetical protein V473_13875 [Sphingobium cupriresistens LL01]